MSNELVAKLDREIGDIGHDEVMRAYVAAGSRGLTVCELYKILLGRELTLDEETALLDEDELQRQRELN